MNVPGDIAEYSNILCVHIHHKEHIDSFIGDLLKFVIESGFETLPVRKPKEEKADQKRKCTAGWKE
jgi:hypothetical protein